VPIGHVTLAVAGTRELLLKHVARRERGVALRLGRPVDAGAVLRADVVALAHALRRVVAFPEDAQQGLVGRLRGVEPWYVGFGVKPAAYPTAVV
jgi:hypothetical protein